MDTPKNIQNSPVTLKMASSDSLLEWLRTDGKTAYLLENDPTEYFFAIKNFGSWDAWESILNREEYIPIIANLRSTLIQKLRSEALSRIIEAAKGETRDALGANKYIYEVLDKDKKNNIGRPSKEAISKEASRLVEEQQIREEAYNRIFNNDAF